mmetsp:Transcript_35402/g.105208  ORF Transcript_35402/g.105208 Transcript_35402/m.105208 type:complete len:985 (-) Transcript_35402:188-3142(-)
MTTQMKAAAGFGSTHSHGDLHNLEIIEDRSGTRRKHGLPARYSKGRFLGKGGFAKCYEVQDMETKEIFAAKIVSKASITKPRAHAKLRSEIAIHRSLDHDKVVKFYDYFEDNDHVYIILELCGGQTMNEFMRKRPAKRLSEPEAMFYIYDLIVALKYLHRRRVIHRDLKLGNLFLDSDMRLKVGDFGLAAQLEHDGEKKRTICGTPNYIAPEILEGKHGHSYEVDIWSLGVILYTMIIGRPPFETSDVKTTYRRIRYNQYSFPESVRISEQAKDLISCILRTDPRSRPSLDEILASPWFQGAQRVPPSMPNSVSAAYAVSPRMPANGGSSARSETPERGAADFARIDSPVPRFPLRDRSPSSVPAAPQGASLSARGAPQLPSKQPPTAPPSYSGSMTPGRYAPSSGFASARPPLAQRNNDENAMPASQNANVGSHDPCAAYAVPKPQSPTMTQGLVPAAAQVRPQSAGLTTSVGTASAGRLTGSFVPPVQSQAQVQGQPSTVLRSTLAHVASARDSSPLLGAAAGVTQGTAAPMAQSNGAAPLSARLTGYVSARSATSSPRQPPALSGRLPPGAQTPKDTQGSRSARGLGSSGGSEGAFTRTTPSMVQGAPQRAPLQPPYSSARSLGTVEGVGQVASYQPPMQHAPSMPAGGSIDVDMGSASMSARISSHVAMTPPPSATDRLQTSARGSRSERSSSSPALFFDAAGGITQREPVASGSGSYAVPVAGGSGSYAPATSSRQCPSPGGSQVSASAGVPASGMQAMPGAPELWVTKWVDYSSKYGVGYILSDGSIGVYFNDSTKIILAPDGSQFDYITRRTQEKPEVRSTHTFDDHPEDLKKKVTLLRHFKNYMLTDVLEKKDGASVGESSLPPPASMGLGGHSPQASYAPGTVPFVKKWTRNKHAIMFQLSNKIVQVVFFDRTEAVLSSKAHAVTYVDKRGQVMTYPLSNVLEVPSPELAKRLRYTKDILVNMLGARATELAGVH